MDIRPAKRIATLPIYAFKLIIDKVNELKNQGGDPIDFGVGDPTVPTPEFIRTACKKAVDERADSGYPSYIGTEEFRIEIAKWTKNRFGVEVDPQTEVSTTIGSKEGICNFPLAVVNPGDTVIIPSPGYPPYSRGTRFVDGKAWFYPLEEGNNFLPDLEAIPDEVAESAKILWINYPHAPSGVCPGIDFYERVLKWTREREIILASDEAYSEYYYGEKPPPTALQTGKEGVVVFNSLSKRSAMTTYRVGFIMGDPRIVEIFRKMKTNVDSGTPTFLQDAARVALQDETHVVQMREEYRKKRDIVVKAFTDIGLPDCSPEGTIYIWQKVPSGMTSMEFADRLIAPDVAVVVTPGSLIAEETADGHNPGEGYVRLALTPPMEKIKLAAKRIANIKL